MDRYELVVSGEAEVISGPLRRIRELAEYCRDEHRLIHPADILAILDEEQS